MTKIFLTIGLWLFITLPCMAQQEPDTTFAVGIENPAYEKGKGPLICIDSAHHNFHTERGGFAPFARVARIDGYRVHDFDATITNKTVLAECDIYLIANPLHESNIGNWTLPNPSAFTREEIDNINQWVIEGGVFFLIADHMPFAGAAYDLGKSFGFGFSNGFAMLEKEPNTPDVFSTSSGRLHESPVSGSEITSVTSFTGSAFTYPDGAIEVMGFKSGDYSLEPEIAWQFNDSTKAVDLSGYAQGVLLEYGEGKLAVFGEAAMFTAQIFTNDQGTFRFGLNSEQAPQNLQFLLNILHWLD